jgi:hypothetical protein
MSFGMTKASSNFFHVKDKAKFEEWADGVCIDVVDLDDGTVAIEADEGWPCWWDWDEEQDETASEPCDQRDNDAEAVCGENEGDDEGDDVRFAKALSKHLADNSVAVLTTFFMDHEAGSGWGIAINAEGKWFKEYFPCMFHDKAKSLGSVIGYRPCNCAPA